jgi:hypothetical protein
VNLAIMGSQFRSGERQTESKGGCKEIWEARGAAGAGPGGANMRWLKGAKYRHFYGRGLPSALGHSGTVNLRSDTALRHCQARLAQVVPECQ